MVATVLYKQSLLDVVLQLTGSIEGVVAVAQANNISITDDLVPGQKIIFPESVELDEDIMNYYKAKKVQPATAMSNEDKVIADKPEGISYWGINIDFEVQ